MDNRSSPVAELVVTHFGQSSESIWRVASGGQLQDFLQDIAENAVSSVHSLTPRAGPSLPMSRGAVWASRVVRRGLQSRTVLGSAASFSLDERDYYRWLVEIGADVRWSPHPIDRLLLVDGQLALIRQDPASATSHPLIITNPSLVAVLDTWFELSWACSRLLSDGFDGDSATLARDIELLKLLEAGLTDDAVARRLGISTRQLGRRVAALAAQFGVAGRVGLGAAAARAGWL